MTDIDPAAVMDAHKPIGLSQCIQNAYDEWPCEPYRLAEALAVQPRAAVVKALHRAALISQSSEVLDMADAIENGADL